MEFERGKKIKEALSIGRGPDAFQVDAVYVRIHQLKAENTDKPCLGRYFIDKNENPKYLVNDKVSFSLIEAIIKKDTDKIRLLLKSVLDEVDADEIILVSVIFKGIPGKVTPEHIRKTYAGVVESQSSDGYFFRDLRGIDIIINGDICQIPKGRILPSSDFQAHLNGNRS